MQWMYRVSKNTVSECEIKIRQENRQDKDETGKIRRSGNSAEPSGRNDIIQREIVTSFEVLG